MIRTLLILLIVPLVLPAYAALRVSDFSTGGNTFAMGTWSGTNNMSLNVDFCVMSLVGNRNSTVTTPYRIKFRDRSNANNPFQLTNDSSGESLPLTVRYTDLVNSNNQELATNTFTATNKTGALVNCPNGLNARLSFSLQATDLNSVSAGEYRNRFRIVVRGGEPERRRRVQVTVSARIDSLVQLSNVNDIFLGNYSGNGDISATESLCVYRNNTGSYQVTALGSGVSNAYSLQANGSELPFALFWNDGSGDQAMAPNTALNNQQNTFTANTHCNNGGNNNVSIRLQASANDLSQAPAGLYQGVITFMISPE